MHPYIYAGLKPKTQWSRWSNLSADEIISEYCSCFGLSETIFKTTRQSQPYADARKMLSAIFTQELGMSRMSIGRLFKRDHSSIIHALQCHNGYMKSDSVYRHNFNQFKSHIENRTEFIPISYVAAKSDTLTRPDIWYAVRSLHIGCSFEFGESDYILVNEVLYKAGKSDKYGHLEFRIVRIGGGRYNLTRTA